MEKKNTGLIVIIIILALLVGLLGGYVINDKLIEKEPAQTENNDNKNSDDKNTEKDNNQDGQVDEPVEKEFDLDDAEKLMTKYMLDTCGKAYVTNLSNGIMATLAIKNTSVSEKVTCESLKNDDLDKYNFRGTVGILYDQCLITNNRNFYKYDNVLSTYKKLFGSSKSLNKESFDSSETVIHYFYSKSKDGFVELEIPAGFSCGGAESSVKSAKTIGKVLEIVADVKVSESSSTGTYKYTFKQEDNNYYLVDITLVE